MTYAMIKNNEVINVIEATESFINIVINSGEYDNAILNTEELNLKLGDKYDSGQWITPQSNIKTPEEQIAELKAENEKLNDALLITINDGVKTQGLDNIKSSICSFLSEKGYYFYGLINEDNICTKLIVSKDEIIENDKIQLSEYSEDYLGRKWIDNTWSLEKYEYPQETSLQEQIDLINDALMIVFGF